MAILGIGIDVVSIERVASIHGRHGEAFARRICRPGEHKDYSGRALIEHLGGLFAAKEALFKALGTGWGQGVGFRQVEIVHLPTGAPTYRLHEAAAERAEQLGVRNAHLSITHEREYAAAVAILEGGVS
ncbi:MAG: holo-[acyl-carrier-protein] synthase [bacterium]|nr:holo-[acyl-carrier-protein] synthase [bacterium]